MKQQRADWIVVLALLVFGPLALAQTGDPASVAPHSNPQNIEAYIDLLHSDVRQEKAELMGEMMQLSASDAAKFWPLYDAYDKELIKLNDLRVANIKEYADSYDHMTDEKADELVHKAMGYRNQRSELLAKYYGRVKEATGGIIAARFLQVEDQLLSLIDLEIDSLLPVASHPS